MGVKHEPALDGLRALACVAVLLRHTDTPFFAGGGRGVDVFFVLSGYLITSILLGRPSLADFWRRRARRLLPALISFVVIYLAVWPLIRPEEAAGRWREALLALTYTKNLDLMGGFHASPLAHVWSLAVEAQFYLVWPLVLPLILRRARPRAILLGMWAYFTALRTISLTTPDFAYYAPHLHSTGLLLGAAVALRPPPAHYGRLALFALVLVFVFGARDPREPFTIPLAEISTAALIPALCTPGILNRAFSWRPAAFVGLISYGIYLWHYPIAYALKGWAWNAPVTLGLAITFAAVSHYTVERFWRLPRVGPPKLVAPREAGV